jgi:hypothetical protein
MVKINTTPTRNRPHTDPGHEPATTPAKQQRAVHTESSVQVVQHAATDIADGIASQDQARFALQPRGSLLKLAPFYPYRPLDHAWQTLLRWYEIQHLGPAWTADLPPGALAFVQALRKCQHVDDHRELKATMPHHYAAFWLSVRKISELRWQVEARILARQSWDTIAAKTHLSPEALQLYEVVFFHVTDRLDATSWVLHEVIGSPEGARRLGATWQYYGYRGGAEVLDTIVYGYPSSRDAETLNAVRKFLVEDGVDDLLIQRMLRERLHASCRRRQPAKRRGAVART